MTLDQHETAELEYLAQSCLSYLIANPEELANFMGHTGMDADALRQGVGSREFATGLMDYFSHNESSLVAMCANASLSTERFMRMWHQLNPGM